MNGPIWPNIKLVPDFMAVLVTCKYDEDTIKKSRCHLDNTFSIISLLELAERH